MNIFHRRLCRSEKWKTKLHDNIMPFALAGVDLGDNVLEIGSGPGLTTEFLSRVVPRLTALEIDPRSIRALRTRFRGAGVTVVRGDALSLPFPAAAFSGALTLTMLHHVPSPELQDQILREVARVLKPGGVFAGVDSLTSFGMRLLHIGDTLVPLDPATFAGRLEKAGFHDVVVQANAERLRFRARR
jgi:ubiquinone/menaquinone biosynthesis C-methylase UbiE